MAQFDLTSKMSPYLDTHLILPLLEFLESTNVCSGAVTIHPRFAVRAVGGVDVCE